MNMLRTDLPEIITETLPGPKAQAIIDRIRNQMRLSSCDRKGRRSYDPGC